MYYRLYGIYAHKSELLAWELGKLENAKLSQIEHISQKVNKS